MGAGRKTFQVVETACSKSLQTVRCHGGLGKRVWVGGRGRAKGLQGAQEDVGTSLGQIVDSFDLEARKSALSPGGKEAPLKVSEPGQERSDLHFRLIIWTGSGGKKALGATSFH